MEARNKLEFGEFLEIVDNVAHNQIFEFDYFDPYSPFNVEFIEREFADVNELLHYIRNQSTEINRIKRLRSVDYLLQQEYYNARIKGRTVYLVMRDDDAIICRAKVSSSHEIDTTTFETYKTSVMKTLMSHN